GIEPRAEPRLLPRAPRDEPVQAVRDAGRHEHDERPSQVPVDDQDDERGDEQHPQQRELIGRRQRGGHRPLFVLSAPASAAILTIAAIASSPLIGLDGSKLLSAPTLMTPAATDIDAAG